MLKYRNRKTVVDGMTFDSVKEASRFAELTLMQRAGLISDLRRQVSFQIDVNGQSICRYVADHVYRENGTEIVEDVKSPITRKLPEYRLKNKLLRAVHGVAIREV